MFNYYVNPTHYYSPQIEIYGRAHHTTASEIFNEPLPSIHNSHQNENVPLEKNLYYFKPDIVLSFFPHFKTNGTRVIKLWLAGELLWNGSDDTGKSVSSSLKTQFLKTGLGFVFLVNDQINQEGCVDMINPFGDHVPSEEISELAFETGQYGNYNFHHESDSNSDVDYYYFNIDQTINFNFNCFDQNEWNKIKIWWGPRNSQSKYFDSEIIGIDIFFRFKSDSEFNLDLNQENFAKIEIPYVFRIQISNNSDQTLKITPIASQILKINNLLPEKLKNIAQINNFLEVTVQSMNVPTDEDPRKHWNSIFNFFNFSQMKNDWFRYRSHAEFFIDQATVFLTSKGTPDLSFDLIQNFEEVESPAILEYTPNDNTIITVKESTSAQYLKSPVTRTTSKLSSKKGYWWSFETKNWKETFENKLILLNNPQKINQKINILIQIQISGIWNSTINIVDTFFIRNDFFQKIGFKKMDNSLKEKTLMNSLDDSNSFQLNQEIFWIISHLTMQKLYFVEWIDLHNFSWMLIEKIEN